MGCLKWVRSNVTSLEVVMFLFMFGLFMVVITSQELYLEKACRVNFNHSETICDRIGATNKTEIEQELKDWVEEIQAAVIVTANDTDKWVSHIQEISLANQSVSEAWVEEVQSSFEKWGEVFNQTFHKIQNATLINYKEAQIKQQKFVAELQGYNGLLQSWPAIFFTLFAGPLSEDYGRKPLIIVGLLGYIVLNIAFFINSWFMYELKAEYLLFECLQDLFGGDIVFGLGVYSLLVDKTEPEARTRRMSILQAFMFVGMTFGFALGKPIQKNFGWSGLYLSSMGIILTNLLFVIFVVKEGDRGTEASAPEEKKKKEKTKAELFVELVKKCIKTFVDLFKERPNGMRTWIVTFFVMLILEKFFQAGTYPLYVLFFKIQYGAGTEILGMVFGIFTICTLITQLLLIPVLSKFMRDTSLIILALATSIIGYLIFAFGKSVLVLIVSYVFFGFYASINACSRSLLSKMVSPREIGAVFSTIGISSSVASLLSKPFFALIYRETVEFLPGFYLLVVVGGLTLVFIPITLAHRGLKAVERNVEMGKPQQGEIGGTAEEKTQMLKMLTDKEMIDNRDDNYNPEDTKIMAVKASFGKETDI